MLYSSPQDGEAKLTTELNSESLWSIAEFLITQKLINLATVIMESSSDKIKIDKIIICSRIQLTSTSLLPHSTWQGYETVWLKGLTKPTELCTCSHVIRQLISRSKPRLIERSRVKEEDRKDLGLVINIDKIVHTQEVCIRRLARDKVLSRPKMIICKTLIGPVVTYKS